ncbi:serine O-acetyltransferase [Flavobacterium sp. CG_23.5]|uniref:serine O-acetyltransferase n=1 Tax=Flavobacterium sp. CG_23.5 TaxID=2760708 RepID=UPI001AE2EDC1|nr:serine acetyltransferase [Flavobacterium sp. CG_23.5]MBP2283031.1 serine O-acetyltransferase [Flavobacterium sp. CG_23.5]
MLLQTILSDYKRCGINTIGFAVLFKTFIIMPNPGLKFMTIFRLTQYYRKKNRILFYFFFLWLRRLKVKYGFDISYRTQIGSGFYVGHFGGIVIHGDTIIGDNCNISQGITFGVSNYGAHIGVPKIGNNVFVGPGACVFGNITIGNHVTIGANTVVTENIPDYFTAVSPKMIVIDKDLSPFYIHNID